MINIIDEAGFRTVLALVVELACIMYLVACLQCYSIYSYLYNGYLQNSTTTIAIITLTFFLLFFVKRLIKIHWLGRNSFLTLNLAGSCFYKISTLLSITDVPQAGSNGTGKGESKRDYRIE
jgi:fucose 4-O-acetylase-like acetyltransferase